MSDAKRRDESGLQKADIPEQETADTATAARAIKLSAWAEMFFYEN